MLDDRVIFAGSLIMAIIKTYGCYRWWSRPLWPKMKGSLDQVLVRWAESTTPTNMLWTHIHIAVVYGSNVLSIVLQTAAICGSWFGFLFCTGHGWAEHAFVWIVVLAVLLLINRKWCRWDETQGLTAKEQTLNPPDYE